MWDIPVMGKKNAKKSLNSLAGATVLTRAEVRRKIVAGFRGESARTMLDGLTPGCEIYGFTKGQWSLIDLIDAVLERTGPADLAVCTWTAATADLRQAYSLMSDGRIRSIRWIVDYSFKTRKPEYCEALRSAFGDDCVRVTSTHAKFVVITNDVWSLVIRTSMNLNLNERFENFEISDDRQLRDFMLSIVDEIWRNESAAEAFGDRPYDHRKRFSGLWGDVADSVTRGLKIGEEIL